MNKKTEDIKMSSSQNNELHICQPIPSQIKELRSLWKDTFDDSDEFLDTFFATAFSFDRCRCVLLNDTVVAALYWFDCTFKGHSIAYIYAVATANAYRRQGICHALMTNTHEHLKSKGYAGAILSPATESLFHFYEKMGYKTCAYNSELVFKEDTLYAYENQNIMLHKIDKDKFAKLRPQFLPEDAVLQEKENLDFLETQAEFFTGNNILLTAQKNGTHLQGMEFLGDTSMIPSILKSMDCTSGTFRTIGTETPFGMYYALIDIGNIPSYIGFVFD